ncbi:hypothetical protein ABIE58_001172 [Roseovarius sp. MBR-78]
MAHRNRQFVTPARAKSAGPGDHPLQWGGRIVQSHLHK